MSLSLQSILGAEALAAFEAPGPVARGLPAAAYTSEAVFQLENERIFADSWVFAGLAHELARPGDVVPVTVAGRPVLLVRDADLEVRAFHNVCRHRCLKLVDEPCNVGPAIQCPYHSWTYRLDGALHLAPYFGGRDPRAVPAGFDRAAARAGARAGGDLARLGLRQPERHRAADRGLRRAAPEAPRGARPLPDEARRHHRPGRDRRELEAPDGELHRALSRALRACDDHRTAADGPLHGERAGLPRLRRGRLRHGKRDDTLSADSRYLTLFPNFVLGLYLPDQVGVHLDVPLAPGRTSQRRAVYSLQAETVSDEHADELARLWRDVHVEDQVICERLQEGRASAVADGGGVLSPLWEDAVRSFQERVVKSLR